MTDRFVDRDTGRDTDRAVSEVLGFVAVFSVVVATVAIVTLTGFSTLEEARNAEQMNNAERAFDVLAENMEDIYKQGAPSRATEISLEDAELFTSDTTTINISADDTSTGSTEFEAFYEHNPIIYQGAGDRKIVFSGGAIFREPEEGGVLVREGPFVLNESSTIVTMVKTLPENRQSIGGSTVLVRANSEDRSVDIANQNGNLDEIWINVSSTERRRDLWRRHLERAGDVDCINVDATTVACELGYTPDRFYVSKVEIDVEFES